MCIESERFGVSMGSIRVLDEGRAKPAQGRCPKQLRNGPKESKTCAGKMPKATTKWKGRDGAMEDVDNRPKCVSHRQRIGLTGDYWNGDEDGGKASVVAGT